MSFGSLSSAAMIGGQALLALGGVAALRLQPPADGEMLLVPVAAQTQGELVTFALENGFSIIAAGDTAGSLVVRGERARLGWALRDHGVLVMAADPRSCSPA